MTSKTKRVLTEILKYKVYKLHETFLKEEFPCIYRKFLVARNQSGTNFANRRHVFGFKDHGERFLQI